LRPIQFKASGVADAVDRRHDFMAGTFGMV